MLSKTLLTRKLKADFEANIDSNIDAIHAEYMNPTTQFAHSDTPLTTPEWSPEGSTMAPGEAAADASTLSNEQAKQKFFADFIKKAIQIGILLK